MRITRFIYEGYGCALPLTPLGCSRLKPRTDGGAGTTMRDIVSCIESCIIAAPGDEIRLDKV